MINKVGFLICLILFLVIIDKLGKVVLLNKNFTESIHDLTVVTFCGLVIFLISKFLF